MMTLTEKIFMGTNFNILLPIDCCRTLTQCHLSVISLALLNFRDHRDIKIKKHFLCLQASAYRATPEFSLLAHPLQYAAW